MWVGNSYYNPSANYLLEKSVPKSVDSFWYSASELEQITSSGLIQIQKDYFDLKMYDLCLKLSIFLKFWL